MNDNKFKNPDHWVEGLTSINKKLEALNNPLKGMTDMASKIQHAGIFATAGDLLQMKAQMDKRLNAFDLLFAQSFNLNKMATAIEQMNRQSNAMQSALSGSVSFLLASKATSTQKLIGIDFADLSKSISDKLTTFSQVYEKQLSIAEQLSKAFYNVNNLTVPNWVEKICTAQKTFNSAQIRAIDILSADTLTRITEEFEGESEEVSVENIDKITELFNKNRELKNDLENLYHAFAKRIAAKLKRKKKKITNEDTKEPLRIIAEIVHKHMLGKHGISLQATYIFIHIIKFLLFAICLDIIIEAKGKDLFDAVFEDNNEKLEITPQIFNNNYYVTNNFNYALQCTIKKDTNIYLRKSIKTKCMGRIKSDTVVLIIEQKPHWCFIEAIGIKYNKQLGQSVEKIIKGWVMKKHLESE